MGDKANKGTYTIDLGRLMRDCGYTSVTYDNDQFTLTLGSDGYNTYNSRLWRDNIANASNGRICSVYFEDTGFFVWLSGGNTPVNNFIVKGIYASKNAAESTMAIYFTHPKSQTANALRVIISDSEITFAS